MKQTLLLFAVLLSVQVSARSDSGSVIASGSNLLVQLKNSVGSGTASPGDAVIAEVIVDVAQDGQILVPKGTILNGRVVRSRRSGRLARSGELELSFGELVFPKGETFLLKARVESADEYVTLKNGTIVADSQPLRQVVEIARGATKGTLTGLSAGIVTTRWKSVRSLGRAGLIGGVAVGMLHRGDEVTLPVGTTVMLTITEPLDLFRTRNDGERNEEER